MTFLLVVVQSLEDSTIDPVSLLSVGSDKLHEETSRVVFVGFLMLVRSALRQTTLRPEVTAHF